MIPYIRGKVTSQAHVNVPEGTVEDEFARNGFTGKYAHLYRSEAPVNWVSIDGPLKPHAYDLNQISNNSQNDHSDFLAAKKCCLENNDVRVHWLDLTQAPSYYFRNADSDELYFVHQGKGLLESDFGPLNYEMGDYVLIPRGTVYRLNPHQKSQFLLIESASEFRYPDKGMLGQHALFDPAVIQVPTPDPSLYATGPKTLKIQRLGQITTVQYNECPITTIGWKGTLSVQKINVSQIRPVLSDRYHLPPMAHTTFVANEFVVCTFLPRPLENGDPLAMKVPFYHLNIDFDEVLFYHQGNFFSREGISPGMLTLHPQGIHHGPQSKAIERAKEITHTQEVAVMIDTRRPLKTTNTLDKTENLEYWKSWSKK